MKKTVLGSALALAWCVAAPFAQQQPTSTAEPAHKSFLLTGCLEAGADATVVAFKLTDASSIGPAPAGARAAEAGAVGTAGQKTSYELQPVSGVNAQGMDGDALKAHIGQRVEVTVRPAEVPAAAPTPANLGAQAAKPIEPAPARFSVTAIKRVTGTCS